MRTSSSSPWRSPTSRIRCRSPFPFSTPSPRQGPTCRPPYPRDVEGIPDASLCFAAQLNEIRKTNSNLVIIGKPAGDTKEEYDAEVEDDDADNVEESDGDDFDQETG